MDFKLSKTKDLVSETARSIILEFEGTKDQLIEHGWLGNETIARVFIQGSNVEIRVFKDDGESYVLSDKSTDFMVRRKYETIKQIALK